MKKKILLVDDVKLFLKLEETFFKRTGCEIFTAQSGEEAIQAAQNRQPDLILLDFIMPDMMGDEVCRRLKGDIMTKKIPVMIVSTSASAEDIKKCFDAGAQDYVTKPINAQEVLTKAAAILRVPERIHYRLAVMVNLVGATSGRTFAGASRNISQGGILVECPEELKPGTALKLDLPLRSDQSVISYDGEVVRSDSDNLSGQQLVAIKFVNLTPYQELALSEFIARNQAQTNN